VTGGAPSGPAVALNSCYLAWSVAAEQGVTLSTPFPHMAYREAISKVRSGLAPAAVGKTSAA